MEEPASWHTAKITLEVDWKVQTDLLLYRELSSLLLPEPGGYNTFSIKIDREITSFFVSSSSEAGLDSIGSFFRKLYRCKAREVEFTGQEGVRIFRIAPKPIFRPKKYTYFPGLLNVVSRIPYLFDDLELTVHVTIISDLSIIKRKTKFSFWIDLALCGSPEHTDHAKRLIASSLENMRTDNGLPLRLLKEGKRSLKIAPKAFAHSEDLATVVRLVGDEDRSTFGKVQGLQGQGVE